MRKHMKSGIII